MASSMATRRRTPIPAATGREGAHPLRVGHRPRGGRSGFRYGWGRLARVDGADQTVCGDLLYTDNPIGEFFRLSDGSYVGDAVERDSDDIAGQAAAADGVLYLSADSGVYAFDCRL